VDSAAYVIRTYSHLTEVAIRHSWVSTRPRYAVVTRRTTDVSPYRMIGTVSSKPRLEATGLEFTSPSMRILTFLPWCRCVVVKNKLQKVNPCQVYYSPYMSIKAYPHCRFSKIWLSVSYYTRTTLIPAVTSHP
jgi:hypothetical protein